jgi:hypothetical protein
MDEALGELAKHLLEIETISPSKHANAGGRSTAEVTLQPISSGATRATLSEGPEHDGPHQKSNQTRLADSITAVESGMDSFPFPLPG